MLVQSKEACAERKRRGKGRKLAVAVSFGCQIGVRGKRTQERESCDKKDLTSHLSPSPSPSLHLHFRPDSAAAGRNKAHIVLQGSLGD